MYFKVYLTVLTTCVLCLILLMHFQIQSEELEEKPNPTNLNLNLNFSHAYLHQQEGPPASPKKVMGDPRQSSNEEENGDSGSTSTSMSSSSSNGSSDHFDIVKLSDHLKTCIRDKDHELDMDEYIFVFQQLYKYASASPIFNLLVILIIFLLL